MSLAQRVAVGVTVALSALDGYDVLVATLAAPGIARGWGMDHGALGLMLSMGLVGMALGSLILAPLADLIGRRRMVLLCLGLLMIGTGLSGFAGSVFELSLWRVVTGLGIGAMVAVINPLATEFASERRRDLAVSLMAIGYPIGGVAGGVAATLLLRQFDWPVLFFIGAALALILVPIVLIWLPEPLSFLIERPQRDSLERANRLLARCGFRPVAALPAASLGKRQPLGAVLGPDSLAGTLRVICLNVLYIVPVYYVLSWTPQLVADSGFTPAEAASVALLLNLGGIVGGVAFGWVSEVLGWKRAAVGTLLCFSVAIVAFSHAPADLGVLRVLGTATGFFLFAGACALHTIVSRSFGDHTRATGAGLVLGVGRTASAIAPLATGILFSVGFGREGVSFAMALAVVVSAVLLIGHRAAVAH